MDQSPASQVDTNYLGLTQSEYRGKPSTLCPGCGHNTITNQIISACYELNLVPEKIAKFSGIGCSSKSLNYFLNRSFGFNGLHGRMPSMALGASFADTSIKILGVSGDGDTASIGFGQFKHLIRRNLPMVYIVENNGVYGLTKGQFSATSDEGLELKHQGKNLYFPIDIAMEALISGASFIARSFSGDAKQLKELIKAAICHNGISVIDVISPCVTFHNHEESLHSYVWGRQNEQPLHDIAYIPKKKAISLDDFQQGTEKEVILHDGSIIHLKKLDMDHDPTKKFDAIRVLEEAETNHQLITGLIYINPDKPTIFDLYNIVDKPLNRLSSDKTRPKQDTLKRINDSMY